MEYTEKRLFGLVDEAVDAAVPLQILETAHPWYGGFFTHEEGCASPSHIGNSHHLACGAFAFLSRSSRHFSSQTLLDRLLLAVQFQRRCQRNLGLVDLPQLNPASPPDTAFTVQLLATVVAAARNLIHIPGAPELASNLGEYVKTAALGIAGRGFHTPNHRWVICSALAQASTLFPELEFRSVIDPILAEGIDVNSDGEHSERSNGLYNAVSNRSLRFIADHYGRPELLELVRRNLDFMTHMLEFDGRIETLFSTRQDRGQNPVPTNAADSFYIMACRDQNGIWTTAANRLARAASTTTQNLPWLVQPFFEPLETVPPERPLPDEFSRWFPEAKVWRTRRGKTSATLALGQRDFFALRCGTVRLASLRIQGSYSDCARFTPELVKVEEDRIQLKHSCPHLPNPRYHLTLGRPVAYDAFEASKAERENWFLPAMGLSLRMDVVENGFDFCLSSEGGYDGIQFQVEAVFETPGFWETPDQICEAVSGCTAILKQGYGRFRSGTEFVEIGPGADAHRVWHMRSSPEAPKHFRVLIPLVTPLDRLFSVRFGQGISIPRP